MNGLQSEAARRADDTPSLGLLRAVRRIDADEDGLSLVEMLAAMMILAIAFMGLTATLLANLAAVGESEREAIGTATAMQLVEEASTLPWDIAGVYANDVLAPGHDGDRWRARLDSSDSIDGLKIATIPGPFSVSDRDPLVPLPWKTIERDGRTHTVDLYPVWVDVSGDGVADLKRFIIYTTFVDRAGTDVELRTVADRAPTQDEVASTATGGRILQAYVSPSPVTLDTNGRPTHDLDVVVRFNTGVTLAETTFTYVDGEGNPQTATVTLTGVEAAADGGWVRFATTVHRGTYRFYNGPTDFIITSPSDTDIRGAATLTASGGPYDYVEPDPEPSPSPSPTTSEPTYSSGMQIVGGSPTVSAVCVNGGNWKLTSEVVVTVQVEGITATNGTVVVNYPYWSKKKPQDPGDPDAIGALDGVFTNGTHWRAAVPAGGSAKFAPGESVSFTISASRDDGGNDSVTTAPQLVSSC